MVDAAEELELPLGQPADQVAGAVERARRAEGVGDEALGRQLRPVQVAPRQARAADVQLAGHPDRHQLPVRVEHVHPRVGDGAPDGRRRGPRLHLRQVATTVPPWGRRR